MNGFFANLVMVSFNIEFRILLTLQFNRTDQMSLLSTPQPMVGQNLKLINGFRTKLLIWMLDTT